MLTSHTEVEVLTETDLTTGRKTYVVVLNPLPVITPVGPAPGELRIEVETSGRVSGIKAKLHPTADAVAQVAEVLARIASFDLDATALRSLPPTSQPTLTFSARPEAVMGMGLLRVANVADLTKVLDAPLLADVRSFALTDLAVEG